MAGVRPQLRHHNREHLFSFHFFVTNFFRYILTTGGNNRRTPPPPLQAPAGWKVEGGKMRGKGDDDKRGHPQQNYATNYE